MKISFAKFKMSGIECFTEYKNFAAAFKIWVDKKNLYVNVSNGMRTFKIVEMSNSVEETKKGFVNATKIACNKLYALDRAFNKKCGEHVLCYIESFDEMVEVLESIEKEFCTVK